MAGIQQRNHGTALLYKNDKHILEIRKKFERWKEHIVQDEVGHKRNKPRNHQGINSTC